MTSSTSSSRTNPRSASCSGIDGFKAYHLVRTADGTASISVYETEEGTAASTRAAADWIRENLPDYTGAAPQIVSGDVVIDL